MDTLLKAKLKIQNYTGRVGSVVSGVDLAVEDRPEVFAAMAEALHETGVIFIRDQVLTPEQYMAFGRRFGPLAEPGWDSIPLLPGSVSIQTLIREPTDVKVIGESWHTDQVFRPVQSRYTMLRAIELPPFGGDTCFMNASVAFETLSEPMKETLRPLRAVHSRPWAAAKSGYGAGTGHSVDGIAVHPVVPRHPDTGREILFVNPSFVEKFEGWTYEESRPLLEQLYAHCLQPEFQCRHMWSPNDIVLWDNRQMWHYAVNDTHGHRREMHRLIIH